MTLTPFPGGTTSGTRNPYPGGVVMQPKPVVPAEPAVSVLPPGQILTSFGNPSTVARASSQVADAPAFGMVDPFAQGQAIFQGSYVAPKDSSKTEKVKSAFSTLVNLPIVTMQGLLSPVNSLLTSTAEAISGKPEGIKFDQPTPFGGAGLPVQGVQSRYNELLNSGMSAKDAFINSAIPFGIDTTFAVLLAHNLTGAAIAKFSPESLLKSVEVSRQQVMDITAGRPVPPEVADAFRGLTSEQKSLAAKDILGKVAKPEPSILGRVFGIGPEEATALYNKIMGDVKALPQFQLGAGEEVVKTKTPFPETAPKTLETAPAEVIKPETVRYPKVMPEEPAVAPEINTDPSKIKDSMSKPDKSVMVAITQTGERIYTKLTPEEQVFFNNERENVPFGSKQGVDQIHTDSGETVGDKVQVTREEFMRQFPVAKEAFDKFNATQKSLIQTNVSLETPAGKITKAASDINKELVSRGFASLPEDVLAKFDPITKKATEAKVAEFMDSNLEAAKQSATTGVVPNDVHPQVLFNAIKQWAYDKGDIKLMNQLADSPIATEQSLAAQTLSASGFNKPTNDFVSKLREINEARKVKTAKRTKSVSTAMKKATEIKLTPEEKSINKFLDDIAC